ncbi:response regulator transcription factor [Saccharibacillus sp. CPCC 101409]|uniref:response regulator transcription factor n=1 Tax=Saccharibacillus sp. CPCC 101409 TaxID=3058041 RepID=UPI00267211E0|nr:response regulator transcription factor [Saccharibacillus sp. CPCC 101409]MDO3411833.1 response regulator transcription factor [Saccharibacillus sp. CPCC 101409]
MDKKVLVVDDEPGIRSAISYALRREGYEVETAADGEEALRRVEEFGPSVLVLDVMMPKMDGYEVCRRLENRSGIGIILLTVKNDMIDKIVGLELGADDYMTKPFEIREVLARVKALLRRLEKNGAPAAGEASEGSDKSEADGEEAGDRIELGQLRIRISHRTAELGGQELELTPKEFDLLTLLVSRPARVFTRDELLDRVWSMDYAGGTRTVDIHVQRLRKKLGDEHQTLLQTVYGVGYKAAAPPRDDSAGAPA